MNLKHYTEKELLQQMFPTGEQSNEDLQSAWREFFARYEGAIVEGIRQTCRRYLPVVELTPITIGAFLHRVLLKLAEDDYKELRTFKYSQSNSVSFYLHTLAIHTVLDFFGFGLSPDKTGHSTGKQPLVSRANSHISR
ncbi:MAG: hypothetical protein AB1489_26660 [Acidobacteriota bacterium]